LPKQCRRLERSASHWRRCTAWGGTRCWRPPRGLPARIWRSWVTLLTSHVPADVEQILGRGVPDLGFEAARLARLAVGAGLRGVVASGRDLAVLRSTLGAEPWIVVPGIRSPDAPPDDQARTVTPVEAVRHGATHLVVGRPITRSADPAAAYRQILEAV
jgi:orotidine-5'-phosphate decarboxylase